MDLNGSSGEVAPLKKAAQPVTGALDDYQSLLSLVADRRLVLIGEAMRIKLDRPGPARVRSVRWVGR